LKCTQCGSCCKESQCLVSKILYGNRKICPELIYEDNKYWCGLILDKTISTDISNFAKEILKFGEGCVR